MGGKESMEKERRKERRRKRGLSPKPWDFGHVCKTYTHFSAYRMLSPPGINLSVTARL